MNFGILKEIKGGEHRTWVKPEVVLNPDIKNMSDAPVNTSATSDLFYEEYENACKNSL